MSEDGTPEFVLMAFEPLAGSDGALHATLPSDRRQSGVLPDSSTCIPTIEVNDVEELMAFERMCVEQGWKAS